MKKVTAKAVSGTVTETDLLNGQFTLGTPALGATGILTLDLWGDYVQNIANNTALPVLKVKLGSSVLFQWQPLLNIAQSLQSASRWGWNYRCIIANANATNSQTASISGMWAFSTASTGSPGANASTITTGEGSHSLVYFAGGGVGVEYLHAYNSSSVDMTASQAVTFTTTNGTASTPYDITLRGALLTIF